MYEVRGCNRCGHRWMLRNRNILNGLTQDPVHCPKCRSPYWNKERIFPKKERL